MITQKLYIRCIAILLHIYLQEWIHVVHESGIQTSVLTNITTDAIDIITKIKHCSFLPTPSTRISSQFIKNVINWRYLRTVRRKINKDKYII